MVIRDALLFEISVFCGGYFSTSSPYYCLDYKTGGQSVKVKICGAGEAPARILGITNGHEE